MCGWYLAPAAGSAAVTVLDKQVGSADFALGNAGDGAGTGAGAMMGGHVMLELVGVGAGRGLPSRDLFSVVEVVGEVLGVGVADFPVGGEPGFSLGDARVSEAAEACEGAVEVGDDEPW